MAEVNAVLTGKLRLSLSCGINWEIYVKGGSHAFFAFNGNGPLVGRYDIFDNLGPESCSSTFSAYGPIGKYPILYLRVHPVAGICD